MNFFYFSIYILLFISNNIALSSESMMHVPEDWILTDNKQTKSSNYSQSPSSDKTRLAKFGLHVDNILSFQESVLLESEEKHKSAGTWRGTWRFSSYRTYLSISKSGILGLSALNTYAGTEITWKKRRAQKKNLLKLKEIKAPVHFVRNSVALNSAMTKGNIESKLEPIIRMAVESGKVKNEKNMRKNLRKRVKDAHHIMNTVFSINNYRCKAKRFRLELNFGLSGNISATTVSGDFNLLG